MILPYLMRENGPYLRRASCPSTRATRATRSGRASATGGIVTVLLALGDLFSHRALSDDLIFSYYVGGCMEGCMRDFIIRYNTVLSFASGAIGR
jgi:hypothetical protein